MSVDYNYLECQLQCLIGLRLSLNGIHGILLTAAVERFDLAIGQNGLFKRSLILIKVWVNCESNRFSFLGKSSSVYITVFVCPNKVLIRCGVRMFWNSFVQVAET